MPRVLLLIALVLAALTGSAAVWLVTVTGGKPALLLALPGALVLGMLFLYSRVTLFMLILLTRSMMDPIFDATKIGNFGLGAVVNALVILIAILEIIRRPNPVRQALATSWLPFLLISGVTLVLAPDFVAGLKTYLALVSYAAIFALAIVLIDSEEAYGRWMRVIFLSSLVPVLFGFVDAATGGVPTELDFRIRSTFSHPNIFAFYLVLMISVGFYFFKSNVSYIPPAWRRTIPIYLAMMLALLLMTKTRSAWASCLAFFMLYALIFERRYLLWIVLSGLLALLVPDVRDRLLDLSQGNDLVSYGKLNSYAWRKQIWKEGLAWMEPACYLFGYGLESFKRYSLDFFTLSGGMERGAHSVYVQLLFETGAIGLAAFIWIHVRVGHQLAGFYRQNPLMIFSAIMFLLEFALDAYSDNMLNYLSFNWYLWFVLGAAYAVNRVQSRPA